MCLVLKGHCFRWFDINTSLYQNSEDKVKTVNIQVILIPFLYLFSSQKYIRLNYYIFYVFVDCLYPCLQKHTCTNAHK